MATVIRCDRPECVNTAPAGNTPKGWVPQAGQLYCSPRCATLALGGMWPDDPVPVAYEAALAGEPVDASVIDDRALRVEVLEAALRGTVDRAKADEPDESSSESSGESGDGDGPDESSSSDPEPEPEPEEPQP